MEMTAVFFFFSLLIWLITLTFFQMLKEEVAIDNTEKNGCDCVAIKFYLQKQLMGWVWH